MQVFVWIQVLGVQKSARAVRHHLAESRNNPLPANYLNSARLVAHGLNTDSQRLLDQSHQKSRGRLER